jgi:ABC-type multidrug transport system fused ATPase/permease subunit
LFKTQKKKIFQISQTVGMKIRSSLVTAIYRKALRLSNQARKESQSGEVLNHMSLDAQKVLDSCFTLNAIWAGPIQVIGTFFFLFSFSPFFFFYCFGGLGTLC